MARNLVCSECGWNMEIGIVAQTYRNIPMDPSYWMAGPPEKSFWGTLKTKGKKSYYITAYRCIGCGFMKFYSGPDHSSKK